jgi:hypothetical protein
MVRSIAIRMGRAERELPVVETEHSERSIAQTVIDELRRNGRSLGICRVPPEALRTCWRHQIGHRRDGAARLGVHGRKFKVNTATE